jgi:hypothetical protein
MSVLTYEREPSSLTSTSPYPSLPTNKLSEVKELLDSLVANKSHRAISQVLTPVVNSKTDLNDGSSPDNSPSREAAKMIIKSPKKGILVKRRINDSSIISGMKLTNESYAPTHMSACSFGEISPVKGGSFGPQSEYFLNGPSDQPDQLDGSPILADDEKEKKIKRVTFETTTCFNKPSPIQNQRRPFMVRSSKTLANWFAKERNQRSLDLNQKVAKLTIFKKGMENLQLSSGSSTTATTTINYQNPKFFAPQSKVTAAPKIENSASYTSDPRKVEIKKKLESNAYYLKSAVKIQSPEKDRDVESASPVIRRGTTKNLTDVPKGHSVERIISSQYGKRKEMLSSPSNSFRNPQGSNSMMINISGSAHSMSPKKPDSYQRTIFKDI